MLEITVTGDTKKTDKFLKAMANGDEYRAIANGAQAGVLALAGATPTRSGLTAASWYCTVLMHLSGPKITWSNSHINKGFSVAAGLQYGHGTGTGGYVQGRDYINPAMRPIFERITSDVWRAVTNG